jgi:hypothetical protein
MTINNFQQVMSELSNDKLKEVLEERNRYQPEASAFAIAEAVKRGLLKFPEEVHILFPAEIQFEEEPLNKEEQLNRNRKAEKDMIHGAIWCIGGIAGTMADFGFIFWGAIVFGGVQFFNGLSK